MKKGDKKQFEKRTLINIRGRGDRDSRGISENPIIDFRNKYASYFPLKKLEELCGKEVAKKSRSLRVSWSNSQKNSDENGNYTVSKKLIKSTDKLIKNGIKPALIKFYRERLSKID